MKVMVKRMVKFGHLNVGDCFFNYRGDLMLVVRPVFMDGQKCESLNLNTNSFWETGFDTEVEPVKVRIVNDDEVFSRKGE